MRSFRTSTSTMLALVLALGLAACGDDTDADTTSDADEAQSAAEEGGETDDDAQEDDDGAQEADDGDDGAEPSGSVTLDGEELALEGIMCVQVEVEDDAWRVLADLVDHDGDITMNEGGGTRLYRDDEEWGNRGGDGVEQLDVGEHGVSGQNTMYLVGEPSYDPVEVTMTADITC